MQYVVKTPASDFRYHKESAEHQPVASMQDTVLNSDALFVDNTVVFIMHQGERYMLRRTRNDKLILTK